MNSHFNRLAVGILAALVVSVTVPQVATAEKIPATGRSYCGLGKSAPDNVYLPGDGADTLTIGLLGYFYHFIYDSSSPTVLGRHDRIIFRNLWPQLLTLKRVEDHLVFCIPTMKYELVIERHYCRSEALSDGDTANNEIEQIAFIAAEEIWLTDILYAEWLKAPGDFPVVVPADHDIYGRLKRWRVRPFSQVLPDWDRPNVSCRQ